MTLTERKELDKYYTKPDVALLVWNDLKSFLKEIGLKGYTVVEPSAGDGKMLDVIDVKKKKGFDLLPESENIIKLDFIKNNLRRYVRTKNVVFFGNPPFGKKGKLAIDFVNKSLSYGNTVGFIIPIQFKKYSVQSQINKKAKLVFERELPEDSFILADKTYKVRCVFQIWTLEEYAIDLRLGKPVTEHPDFEMWQYNCTTEALKFFDYNWDFCVLRQGYGNFNEFHYPDSKNELSRKKQWIFIKAKDDVILSRLKSIDYDKLSQLNTATKGFGKHDLVKEYSRLVTEQDAVD